MATVYSPQGQVNVIVSNANKVADQCIGRIRKCKEKLRDYMKTTVKLKTTTSRTLKKKLPDAIRRLKKKYHKAERKAQNVAKNYHYRIVHLKIRYSDLP